MSSTCEHCGCDADRARSEWDAEPDRMDGGAVDEREGGVSLLATVTMQIGVGLVRS